MNIKVNENGHIELSEVYLPVCIRTEHGVYGVCQRDGGLEVVKDGEIVFSTFPSKPLSSMTQCEACGHLMLVAKDPKCLNCGTDNPEYNGGVNG